MPEQSQAPLTLTKESTFADLTAAMGARHELKRFANTLQRAKDRDALFMLDTVGDILSRNAERVFRLNRARIGVATLWALNLFLKEQGLNPEWSPAEFNPMVFGKIHSSAAGNVISRRTAVEDCCELLGYVSGKSEYKADLHALGGALKRKGVATFGDILELSPRVFARYKPPAFFQQLVEEKRAAAAPSAPPQ